MAAKSHRECITTAMYRCVCVLIVFAMEIHSMSHSSFNRLPPGFLIPSRFDICKSANGHRVPEVERYPRAKVVSKVRKRIVGYISERVKYKIYFV